MAITTHTQLLNALIEKYGYETYLEIGVQDTANNFDKINCEHKVGVDPEVKNASNVFSWSSDRYFDQLDYLFELIFIDGLHHADQVKRDFENALRCLTDDGRIVIHDVLPREESTTHVPRDSKVWHGDVYKFAMNLWRYNGIKFVTYNIDEGCMVVSKVGSIGSPPQFNPTHETSWNDYISGRKEVMNIVDVVEV